MFSKNAITRYLLLAIALVMLSFVIKDWADLVGCGAHDSCLVEIGLYQSVTKFVTSFLLTVLAFYVSRFAGLTQDGKWLKIAFTFSLMADFCFRILPLIGIDLAICNFLGIIGFMIYQIVLTIRHTRTGEVDTHFPKIFIVPVLFSLVTAVLCNMGFIPQLVSVISCYGAFLICSLVVACKVIPGDYYNRAQVSLIKIGMIVFFIGDVLVGFSFAIGDEGSVVDWIAAIANNLIWLAYVPAQLLLIKSCVK